MRTRSWLASLAIAVLWLVPSLGAQAGDIPPGWIRAGSHPQDYEMAVDPKGGHASQAAAFIKARSATPGGFGTLMQMFDAADYRGKRLRFSASVKAAGIEQWAGLWMRIDGASSPGTKAPATLGFDNMQDRPIKGTSDWKTYQVVLDVPDEARAIAFGILLSGPGQAWMEDLKLEAVGSDVTATNALPRKPTLSFDPR